MDDVLIVIKIRKKHHEKWFFSLFYVVWDMAEIGLYCSHRTVHGHDYLDDTVMIHIQNLTLGYQRHPAVHHLTLDIQRGSMLAIVGPNGAGKSTLLKGIMGQMKALEGYIRFHDLAAEEIAYLPQINQIDTQFPISVWEMAAMGLWHQVGAFGSLTSLHRQKIDEALACVGLSGFEHRQIGTLSGGQMQRLLFARLLLQEAKLLLLDEPFNAIDASTEQVLLDLLKGWHQEGKTILMVWHHLDEVIEHFPKTLLIAREMIAYGDTASVLTAENLSRAKTIQTAFNEKAGVCLTGDQTC